MKLIFSLLIFFASMQVSGKEFVAEYTVKAKGIKIGVLAWDLKIEDNNYEMNLSLYSEGIFSGLYIFSGEYVVSGLIRESLFNPSEYKQLWITKGKRKEIQINFLNKKISKFQQSPKEIEKPRIKMRELSGYVDPLTSFLNVIITGQKSQTIDGRRIYLLEPIKEKNKIKISIKKYINIWADHKRNDLESLEVFLDDEILPKKIKVNFKGTAFYLYKN